MDNINRCHSILELINKNTEHYKYKITLSNNPYERMYYESLLYNEKTLFNYWENYYYHLIKNRETQLHQNSQSSQQNLPGERVFTSAELAQYDGANGKPAYVAVNGVVYDVSLEATWGGGTHFSLYAGKDLSAQFNGCHSGMLEVLRNLPLVGVLQD